jgi:hypothetical protein
MNAASYHPVLVVPILPGVENGYLLAAALALFWAIWYFTGTYRKKRQKRIKLAARFLWRENDISVRIESVGKLPVEILAPELKFCGRTSSRSFSIKSPGRDIFPLALFPLTDYEFRIDLDRFYAQDKSLHQYRKIKLIVREHSGRLLTFRKMRIK